MWFLLTSSIGGFLFLYFVKKAWKLFHYYINYLKNNFREFLIVLSWRWK